MKKFSLLVCLMLLGASSCTNEVNEEGFVDKANSISFSAYSNKSRANVTNDVTTENMKGDNFGVVGYKHDDNAIYLYKKSGENNIAVEQKWVSSGGSGSWEYADLSDLRFWPNTNMDFYAYFPYSNNATFETSNNTGNVMTIPASNCTHDVLFAFAGNQSKQTRVPLTFYHAFSKIKTLKIEMPAEGTLNQSKCNIEVKGVEFINTSTSGDIKVDKDGIASYAVASTNETLKEDLTSSPVPVNSTTTTGTLIDNGTNAKGYFFATNTAEVKNVIGTKKTMWDGVKTNIGGSGKLSESALVCLKLTCKVWNGTDRYYVGGADSYGVIYIPLTGSNSDPSSVTTFDAGKRYNYTIEMKNNVGYTDEGDPILTPILFNVTSVDGWEDVNVKITL